MKRLYFDHCATTPLHPDARAALDEHLELANPSSVHEEGRRARHALTRSRRRIAELLGVERDAVTFVGNGSEANVLALEGAVSALPRGRRRVLASPIEHPCVRNCLQRMADEGVAELEWLPVDGVGRLRLDDVENHWTNEVGLLCTMAVNHEIGTRQPISALARWARSRGVLLHTDACQAIGRIDASPWLTEVDLATFSAHKFGGPRGVGGLVRRPGVTLRSPLSAHRQEHGLRGGTEDVASIVACAVALERATEELDSTQTHLRECRKHFLDQFSSMFPRAVVHSSVEHGIPALVNFSFPGIPGAWLVAALDRKGVAVSHGSACSSRATLPSPVLMAIGRADLARCAVRVSMAASTGREEVDDFLQRLHVVVLEAETAGRI